MLESEMEDLLWLYPDKFFREPLKQFRRQPRSREVGRADLVFEDRLERLLVVEIKRGQLQRGAIDQVHDYFGMMKHEFPNKSVEMMVIAQSIPLERKVALDRYNIEYREISDKRFREVALEMGYLFQSEHGSTSGIPGPRSVGTLGPGPVVEDHSTTIAGPSTEPRAELSAAVNAYSALGPDTRVCWDNAKNYCQVVPREWRRSYLHYEFYQARGRIGAELHLHSDKVVSLAEFLKPFAGRAVANGESTLEWDQAWNSGRGRLAAFFSLASSPSPETVAAGMRDLISMTRPGVSDYLASHIPAALTDHAEV
jgi:hypothetical protein